MTSAYSLLFSLPEDSKPYGIHLIYLNLTDDELVSSLYTFNVTFLEPFVFLNETTETVNKTETQVTVPWLNKEGFTARL